MNNPPLPLAGIKVLDLSRVLAGPWATQLLADYGAEVIKVERPGSGDDTRSWGPPYVANGDAAYFHSANRNKKSVAINIASPGGADLVRQLASQCDIVIENYKVGGLAKYGLDYQTVSSDHPKVVYCSITGFGQTGPNSARPGYDYLIQAMTGLMSVTGQPDGSPGAEPMKVGVAVSDLFTGLYAVTAILAALRTAEATGVGCHLDVALHDCQVAALANQAMNFLATGESPQRLGNAHPSIVPYQVFNTADGHIVVAVGNDSQFQTFCNCLGRPDIGGTTKWLTNKSRVEDRKNLLAEIEPILQARTTKDWADAFNSAGIPHSPIRSVGDALESAQTEARGQIIDHGGGLRTVGQPVPFPGQAADPPPSLGAHTDAVLQQYLGLGDTDVEALRTQGTVG
jgi:crotonobetainyl-CoA:carnitine CoA-transferase CaiB-like acyl-CoA transferase